MRAVKSIPQWTTENGTSGASGLDLQYNTLWRGRGSRGESYGRSLKVKLESKPTASSEPQETSGGEIRANFQEETHPYGTESRKCEAYRSFAD